MGYSPQGRKESDPTERLTLSFFIYIYINIFDLTGKLRRDYCIAKGFFSLQENFP